MTAQDPAFVEEAYADVLGRAVDPRGLSQALRVLRQGMPREQWLMALRGSGEARRAAASTPAPVTLGQLMAVGPDRVFLRRAYRALCGGAMEAVALETALCELASGTSRWAWLCALRRSRPGRPVDLADVHRLDLHGDELSGAVRPGPDRLLAVSDEAFVFLAYRGVLGRDPDDGGRDAYLRRLRAGERRLDLLGEMAASPEGRARGGAASAAHGTPLHRRVQRQLMRRLRRVAGALRRAALDTQTPDSKRDAP